MYGEREFKYNYLLDASLSNVPFVQLKNTAPEYFFVEKDFRLNGEYKAGFSVVELFPKYTMAVVTANDPIFVDEKKDVLKNKVASFCEIDADEKKIQKIAYRPFDDRFIYYDTKLIERSRQRVMRNFIGVDNLGLVFRRQQPEARDLYVFCSDIIIADGLIRSDNKGGESVAPLYLYPDDDGQRTGQAALPLYLRKSSAFPAGVPLDKSGSAAGGEADDVTDDTVKQSSTANRQAEPEGESSKISDKPHRVPNLNMEIVGRIAEKIGTEFVAEPTGTQAPSPASVRPDADSLGERSNSGILNTVTPEDSPPADAGGSAFSPIDILDYIYAVLHSPAYREKYKEFLKIDFPRVPYPKDAETFWRLVKLGGEIRQIHLLESPTVNQFITGYPVAGANIVEKPEFRGASCDLVVPEKDLTTKQHEKARTKNEPVGRVFINRTQYFDGVPLAVWDFYIGGYQPAQKWLKDRKGRVLGFDDIQHYQKIIVALTETDRLMKEIDEIGFID